VKIIAKLAIRSKKMQETLEKLFKENHIPPNIQQLIKELAVGWALLEEKQVFLPGMSDIEVQRLRNFVLTDELELCGYFQDSSLNGKIPLVQILTCLPVAGAGEILEEWHKYADEPKLKKVTYAALRTRQVVLRENEYLRQK
jgi:hypothetical protein